MAFSVQQLGELNRITGVDITVINTHLIERAAMLTTAQMTEVESQVGDLILEYFPASGTGAGRKFVKVNGGQNPEGADIDPERARAAIRSEICRLLYLTPYMSSGSRLVRA